VSNEDEFGKLELFTCTNCKSIVVEVTNLLNDKLAKSFDKKLDIEEIVDILEFFPPITSIHVEEYNCVGCGLCLEVCPNSSIDLELPSSIHIKDSCVFCGKCAQICNFEAIRLEEKFFTNRNHEIFFIKRDLRGQRKGTFSVLDYACQLCGVCVKNCPTDALTEDGRIIVDQDKCISCRNCETLCPVNAIKISTVWQFND
ncbi:MAG: 4Fe-4S binding protein, partial [archaeon]|nr:4Fe-4S binding protein [archaeon]